jgi:AP-4 complex subunit epsilon-1
MLRALSLMVCMHDEDSPLFSTFLIAALLYGTFLLLSAASPEVLSTQRGSSRPVHNIRHLLTSTDLNEQFTFLSCLECLEPDIWAGTKPETPAMLEGWEVERVMQLLRSSDSLIRKKVNTSFALSLHQLIILVPRPC